MTESPGDSLARDVRKYVFDHFLEYAVPPVLEQIMERYHLERPDAFAGLKALEEARHLKLVPGTQRILMAFPFSAVATPFRTTRPVIGRRYYANCAWDAVAFHTMLHEIVRIESRCHHCAKPISIELAGGKSRASPPRPVVYLASRSEEHTSELQSLRHLVCRLLLEKRSVRPSSKTVSVSSIQSPSVSRARKTCPLRAQKARVPDFVQAMDVGMITADSRNRTTS